MSEFRVFEVTGKRIDQAFALVRLATSLSQPEWRALATRLPAQSGGVLGVSAGEAMLGLAGYCMEEGPEQGRFLRVDPFIAFELSASASVREALIDGLRTAANRLDCHFLAFRAAQRGMLDAYSAASMTSSM